MNIVDILQRYEILADQIVSLLQQERQSLKEGQSTEALFEQKRGLIDELTQMVDQVRAFRESQTEDVSFVSERLQYVQQRLMMILQLDREVEKLFLATSMRPSVPELVPVASKVSQAYQTATACSA